MQNSGLGSSKAKSAHARARRRDILKLFEIFAQFRHTFTYVPRTDTFILFLSSAGCCMRSGSSLPPGAPAPARQCRLAAVAHTREHARAQVISRKLANHRSPPTFYAPTVILFLSSAGYCLRPGPSLLRLMQLLGSAG